MSNDNNMNEFSAQIKEAYHAGTKIFIRGGASKAFLMDAQEDSEILNISDYYGIISYEPSELVITVRAGTRVKSVESMLSARGQCFPFEPPLFGGNATIGGMVASGFSGPSRPFTGSLRDAVLGVKIINGKGEVLKFGGEVIKNVAGYDISRLMAGSFGTLGVILEVSIKVMPKAQAHATVLIESNSQDMLRHMHKLRRDIPNITGLASVNNNLYCRFAGGEKTVSQTLSTIKGEHLEEADLFWESLKNQSIDFFQTHEPLWRMSVAPSTKSMLTDSESVFDWGGALRWVKTNSTAADIHHMAEASEGSAMPFFRGDPSQSLYTLPTAVFKLHQRIKESFDPNGIFNACGLYAEKL